MGAPRGRGTRLATVLRHETEASDACLKMVRDLRILPRQAPPCTDAAMLGALPLTPQRACPHAVPDQPGRRPPVAIMRTTPMPAEPAPTHTMRCSGRADAGRLSTRSAPYRPARAVAAVPCRGLHPAEADGQAGTGQGKAVEGWGYRPAQGGEGAPWRKRTSHT